MVFVNGPYNVVRLEGNVGKVKKVLYVFFDVHNDVSGQTECQNIRSIEI